MHLSCILMTALIASLGILSQVHMTAAAGLERPDTLAKMLFQSVRNDDPDLIREQLNKGADINTIGPGGQTPLMHAVLQGRLDAVRFLLRNGADTSIGEKDGFTPLHGAGFQGRAKIATELLKAGMDPMEYHQDGYLAMHRACWGTEARHAQTVKVFLADGVPPAQAAKNGKTCAEMATNNKMTQKVLREYARLQKKLEKGFNVDAADAQAAAGAEADVKDEL